MRLRPFEVTRRSH